MILTHTPKLKKRDRSHPLQEAAKTRRRKQVKAQRAVVGASLDVIKERRSQRPETRTAARAEAVKAGKEKRKQSESAKKAEKAKSAAHTTGRYVTLRIALYWCAEQATDAFAVLLASSSPRVLRPSQSPLPVKRFRSGCALLLWALRDHGCVKRLAQMEFKMRMNQVSKIAYISTLQTLQVMHIRLAATLADTADQATNGCVLQ